MNATATNLPIRCSAFSDIGPLLATALHEHPRLREMNVQFPAQETVRATVIGAGPILRSLSGSTIWLEDVQLPLRNSAGGDPADDADLVNARGRRFSSLISTRNRRLRAGASRHAFPVRYAVTTVINALTAFVARYP